jgi:hypothetical protein
LQNIPNVDKVTVVSAPLRTEGCCWDRTLYMNKNYIVGSIFIPPLA